MYQFTEMFGELGVKAKRKSYRWRGLAAGLFLGWVPAWATAHYLGGGAWAFMGIWIAMLPSGYFSGQLLKK